MNTDEQPPNDRNIFLKMIEKKAIWFFTVLLTYLNYFAALRPSLLVQLGIYSVGFLDGVIISASAIIAISYVTYVNFKNKYTSVTKCKRKDRSERNSLKKNVKHRKNQVKA
jgi:hypothetical protein